MRQKWSSLKMKQKRLSNKPGSSLTERRKRITASNVGSIEKMRKTTKRSKKVQYLLYSGFTGNTVTHYGSVKDEETRQLYTAYQKRNGHPDLTVDKCGLFVSLTNPWLAASPDGSVKDPNDTSQKMGLVEIKNPLSMRGKTLAEACTNSAFC